MITVRIVLFDVQHSLDEVGFYELVHLEVRAPLKILVQHLAGFTLVKPTGP